MSPRRARIGRTKMMMRREKTRVFIIVISVLCGGDYTLGIPKVV